MTLLSKCCGKEAYKAIGGLFLNRKIWVCSECGKYCKVYKPYQVEEEKTMEIGKILDELILNTEQNFNDQLADNEEIRATFPYEEHKSFNKHKAETALQVFIDKKVKEAVERLRVKPEEIERHIFKFLYDKELSEEYRYKCSCIDGCSLCDGTGYILNNLGIALVDLAQAIADYLNKRIDEK